MLAKVSTAEQGSYQWLKDRIGYVTASDVHLAMAKGTGAARVNYMVKMICERLSGEPTRGFKSKAMQDGNDNEPMARQIYEEIMQVKVTAQGFYYIEAEKLGASTDGEVDADGDIEIKNVIPAEQVKLLTTGRIKAAYMKQMQTQMYVREKKWVDYVSVSLGDEYNGELPDRYKVKIIRVERDDDMIEAIREEVAQFHGDVAKLMNKLVLA